MDPVTLEYQAKTSTSVRVGPLYVIEAIMSIGTMMLMVGVFFYTEHRFHWSLVQNFMLAAAQGVVYVIGALSANALQRRWGRGRLLVGLFAILCVIVVIGMIATSQVLIVAILLIYTAPVGAAWPALESLVASDVDPAKLSRRLSVYNLIWAGAGALAIASNGAIIEHWRVGVFIIPLVAHALSIVLIVMSGACSARLEGPTPPGPSPHALPEPELLRQRKLALWLSRISLPSTYVVIYGLMAMLPLLPAIKRLGPTEATAICSSWMIARFVAFVLLGATTWWHARPQLLLVASLVMLLAFLGTALPAAETFAGLASSRTLTLQVIILSQILLGLAMGIIYSGSLYFGMVLSDGSTEHGGYHEALIGGGQVLGPGLGAIAQVLWPGAYTAGIATVAAILALSVVSAVIATSALSKESKQG